jgi:ABC-type Fe3+-hydroxamate transport system substrate-binding protein
MKYLILVVLALVLAGCSNSTIDQPQQSSQKESQTGRTTEIVTKPQPSVALSDLGVAPELTNQVWLNTDQPLRLAELRGQVVLLDMWTFG